MVTNSIALLITLINDLASTCVIAVVVNLYIGTGITLQWDNCQIMIKLCKVEET